MAWTLFGYVVSVEEPISWPHDISLLNPIEAHQYLLENAIVGKHRGVVMSYTNSIDGVGVVNCVSKMMKMDPITMYDPSGRGEAILALLTKCHVIEICGKGHLIKSKLKQVYHIAPHHGKFGCLYLDIVSARGLLAQDILGTSSPFAIVGLGSKKFTSKIVKQSLDPVWNEIAVFVVKQDSDLVDKKNAVELSLCIDIFSDRVIRSRVSIGVTSNILVSSMKLHKNTVSNVDRISLVHYPLKRALNQGGEHIFLKAKGGLQHALSKGLRTSKELNVVANKNADKKTDREDTKPVNAEDEYSSDEDGDDIGLLLARTTSSEKPVEHLGGGLAAQIGTVTIRHVWMPGHFDPRESKETRPLLVPPPLERSKSARIKTIFGKKASMETRVPGIANHSVNAQHRETMFQSDVKKTAELIKDQLLPRLEQEITVYETEKAAGKFTKLKLSEKDESEEAISCFVFDRREIAFQIMSSEECGGITRSVWCVLAPMVGSICTQINAHTIFDSLLNVQFGNKEFESVTRSGQLRSLKCHVFMDYVEALSLERLSMLKRSKKLFSEFPELLMNGDEILLDYVDNVRGSRNEQDVTSLRKSHYGGKLAVTPSHTYFCKHHMFSQNEIIAENLVSSVQVVESNGTTEYGLMIGMGTRASSSHDLLDLSDESKPSTMLMHQGHSFDEFDSLFGKTVDSELEDDEIDDTVTSVTSPSGCNIEIKKAKRYVVYRFPLISTKSRNFQLLLLRELVAFQIFIHQVIRKIVDSEVSSVQDEKESKSYSKEMFMLHVQNVVYGYLETEISNAKAMLRMKEDWLYLHNCDTFRNFGEEFKWRNETHFTMYNLMMITCQTEVKKKYLSIRKFAVGSVYAFAFSCLEEAAVSHNIRLNYKREYSDVIESFMGGYKTNSVKPMIGAMLDKYWIESSNLMMSEIIRSATKLKSMGQNVDLMLDLLDPVISGGKFFKEVLVKVLVWEDPVLTVGLGVISLVMILTGLVSYLPTIVACSATCLLVYQRYIRQTMGFRKMYIPIKKSKTIIEKYRNMKAKYAQAKKVMWRINLALLKLRALFTWDNEDITVRLVAFLALLTLFITVAPKTVYYLMMWVYVFTKKFRSGNTSRKIKAYLAAQWTSIRPSPLWEK